MPVQKRRRSTATYLRRIGAKNLRKKFGERVRSPTERIRWQSRYTGQFPAINSFGRLFVASFPHLIVGKSKSVSLKVSKSKYESDVAIALFKKSINGHYLEFQAKIGFDKSTVFIEAIQGPAKKKGPNPEFEADSLNSELGMPWPNFLLKKIEQHAGLLGFKRIFIHDPRTSAYFDLLVDLSELSGVESKKLLARVKNLHKLVSNGKNPQLSRNETASLSNIAARKFLGSGGRLLWKNASVLAPDEFESTFFNLFYSGLQREKEKKRIINFISWVAKKNGYARTFDGFEKKL